jgi:hypothetical protein
MSTIIRVKGIYDGEQVQLTAPLDIPPYTEVEVLVPEQVFNRVSRLHQFHQELLKSGRITGTPTRKPNQSDFEPISVSGKPVSETIIEERR